MEAKTLLWDAGRPAATWEAPEPFALAFAEGRPVKAQEGKLLWDAAAGPDESRRGGRPEKGGRGGPKPGPEDLTPGPGLRRLPLFAPSLAVGGGGRSLATARGAEIAIWRAEDPGRTLAVVPPAADPLAAGRPWFRRPLAVSPTADRLYFLGPDGDLHAWRLDAEAHAATLPLAGVPTPRVTSLALSADGRTLAVGGADGTVTLLDALGSPSPRRLTALASIPPESATSLAFSPDGTELAVGGSEGPVHLWKLGPGDPSLLVRLPGHRGPAAALAFDADGRRLAAADEKGVEVWDLGRLRKRLEGLGLGW